MPASLGNATSAVPGMDERNKIIIVTQVILIILFFIIATSLVIPYYLIWKETNRQRKEEQNLRWPCHACRFPVARLETNPKQIRRF